MKGKVKLSKKIERDVPKNDMVAHELQCLDQNHFMLNHLTELCENILIQFAYDVNDIENIGKVLKKKECRQFFGVFICMHCLFIVGFLLRLLHHLTFCLH